MSKLNYHHLNYFWQVAKEGNLTKAAERLHVSQSALSSQIAQLEHNMGVQLFARQGRRLILTEIGQTTFSYADEIFRKGGELESLLLTGENTQQRTIKIGMLATMSRNFIESFIEPLIQQGNSKYSLHARGQARLLNELANHQLDIVLSNIDVSGSDDNLWKCQLLARQPVAIIGQPTLALGAIFSADYAAQDWILPVDESPIRSAFDAFCALHQFQPKIVAEADDMAMMRLLARDSNALTVMPEVVVKDELKLGKLHRYMILPNVYEHFYAITVQRHLPNQIVGDLILNVINTRPANSVNLAKKLS
ncbi:LysR family transcriptional regulator [Deefgea piscis]|uniref:LysR family transcriptional regulator n=1 Tax=Deefgea piscis TaxID=2739061 RepID=UPI001C7F4753|nr:LysR family transcriptional regulator [Deefgea piscis]QZA82343.1 LysR family transcriptional regulator [Deefgea piscis]